ncbi:MAG: outer membrane beta-barrel protein [Verrucomicrobiae bacterium]|nr:outer membrane beta-barrel protein [Verrucomicrobiae bacterium]
MYRVVLTLIGSVLMSTIAIAEMGETIASKSKPTTRLLRSKPEPALRNPFYVAANGGMAFIPTSSVNITAGSRWDGTVLQGASCTADAKFDNAAWTSCRFGYEFFQKDVWALAVEPDFSYFSTKFTAVNPSGGIPSSYGADANVDFYNFDFTLVGSLMPSERLKLYAGPGLVVSCADVTDAGFTVNGSIIPGTTRASDSDTAVGFQAILGLRFFMSERFDWSFEYRYRRVEDHTLSFPLANVDLDKIEAHILSLGLCFHF